MGTRARIAMENDDGSFTSIYTHWDGYPSHHGPILLNHYTDPAKVQALMALGDLSVLGEEIGEKHDFDAHPDKREGQCNAYGRDRGEKDIEAVQSASLTALNELTQECGGEYLYVLRKDGTWYCGEGGIAFFGMPASEEPGALLPLTDVLRQHAEDE